MMNDSPCCERCGGPTHYEGNVTAPDQTIYGCAQCGRQTWVKRSTAQQQQQQSQQDEKKRQQD
jgi:DNA-directed RNA polymerase subunit RPC12/RpoP